ncbi:hypothetical protein ACF0H5_020077 [Mactra antiquata]
MDRYLATVSIFLVLCAATLPGMFGEKICWDSQWFNNSAPTNRSEYEKVPQATLDKICSTGSVKYAQCKDNRGEPFSGHKIDKFNEYEAFCNITGLECNPFTNSSKSCPDLLIQFGCTCPTSTVSPPSTRVNPSTSVSTSKPASPSSTGSTIFSSTFNGTMGNGFSNSSLQRGGHNGSVEARGCIDLMVLMISLVLVYFVN